MKKVTLLLLTILVLTACEYEFPDPVAISEPSADADFSNIVFVGGSRLAGIEDGALSIRGNQYAVPNLFLKELGFVDTDQVVTPRVNSENGFNIYENADINGTTGAYRVFFPSADTVFFKRELTTGTALAFENAGDGDLNSFSFPGASILDVTESGRSLNPYTNAFFDNSQSILARATSANPSFFVLDLGYQDMLNFVLNGATGDMNAGLATAGVADLPSEAFFRTKLEEATNALLNQNASAKGVLINIPDFTLFPYFVRTSYDVTPFVISERQIISAAQGEAALFNNSLIGFYQQNPGIPSADRRPFIDYGNDSRFNWGIMVEDQTLADVTFNGNVVPKVRQLKIDDYMFYKEEQRLRTGYGMQVSNPVPNNGFISFEKGEEIKLKIAAYNAIIQDVANNSGGRLVVADTYTVFNQMTNGFNKLLGNAADGLNVDGVVLEPRISRFGVFSTDGLNLNPVGNAIIVNTIVSAINNNLNGNLRQVNPNNLPGTVFTNN
ncbi:hypothetical protein [Roseivirga sp. E12]|uniref:hypothetical protein n=1 Tax=Roseivirga sp. E12 TaxID=2819237 RepID=UPI001ABD2C8E|nr:hypothetical protein [Roseivirga sp. E12]